MAHKRVEFRLRRLLAHTRAAGVLGGLACASLLAHAQATSAAGRSLVVTPRLTVSETLTDNLRLASGDGDAALLTTVSPGLNIASRSGRIRGVLDYALNGLIYSKSDEPSEIRHTLSSQASLEAIENWLFINGSASISVQPISAFGAVAAGGGDLRRNANSTEVANLSLSPSVQGQLGGMVGYRASASLAQTRAKDSIAGDNRSTSYRLGFNGLGSGRLVNWSLDLDTSRGTPSAARGTRTDSVTGSLDIRPDVDWRFTLTGGRERSDLSSAQRISAPTYGGSAHWTPTPRTVAAASWQHHDYGNSHSLTFQHRMARSVWRMGDTQSVSQPGVQGASGRRTNYDLLFLQFEGLEPDPVRRDLLVRAYLQTAGLSPDAIATSGYLTAISTLSRRQEFSFSLQGQRSTVTFLLNRTRNQRLDLSTPTPDDLNQSDRIEQRGFTLSVSHRLTPDASASVGYSHQQSLGSGTQAATDLKSLTANWSARLGRLTSLQLGVRRTAFDSPTQPYRENALLATILQQF